MSSNVRTGKVRIVFHPASGRGLGMRRAYQLAAALDDSAVRYELIDTSLAMVENLGQTFRESRALVIIGGDGLIHHTIQHLAGTQIPIGIIPAGSGNDFWRATGDKNAEESLAKVVDFCKAPRDTTPVDLFELRFEQGTNGPRFALGAVSWGFEATVNAKANTLPRQLGALRYIVALIMCVPQLRGYDTKITAQEFSYQGSVLAASLANIQSLGGGIRLFPQANFSDGTAELMMVRGPKIMPVLPHIAKILSGAPHPWKVSANLRQAQVHTDQESYADGEFVGRGPFQLQVIPAGIQLIS